jgi:predicted transcriptional regulator
MERKPTPNLSLKLILFEAGVSQRRLAWGSGVPENSISKILKGYREPTENEKEKIFRYLASCED